MPVYKLTIEGLEKPRIVRADTAAQALNHVVSTETIKADDLADLVADGVQIERAVKKAPVPETAEGEEGQQAPGLSPEAAATL